jgi:hypothetical protein
MLQRANQLVVAGDYAAAVVAFTDLAQRAEERFPQRAPILYMEAGRVAILGGDVKTGIAQLWRGLTILSSQGRIHRMRVLGQRAVDELTARGLNAEAEEIASLLNADLPKGIPAETSAPSKKPVLPTHCPSCGAAVRPDEVDWLDDVTAECDYCGSPVRGD